MGSLRQGLRLTAANIGKLGWWLQGVTAVIVWIMTLVVVLQVVMRYVFSMPLDWTLEITEYMMVALVFLALAYIQNQRKHIRIEFLTVRLKQSTRNILAPVLTLLALFFFILITWTSWEYALRSLHQGYRSETAGIPLFPAQVIVPIGAFLMCLQLIVDLVYNINSLRIARRNGNTES